MAQVVQCYAEGLTGMPDAKKMAKRIIDKWSRIIYEISSNYDADGFDRNYRSLQNKLSSMKQTPPSSQDARITRSRIGIILPERNAFDFIERPERRETTERKKAGEENGKAKLQKTLLQLKRSNTKGTGNKSMATVKIDI